MFNVTLYITLHDIKFCNVQSCIQRVHHMGTIFPEIQPAAFTKEHAHSHNTCYSCSSQGQLESFTKDNQFRQLNGTSDFYINFEETQDLL